MSGREVDLLGMRFGRLTVISKAPKDKRGWNSWVCVCDCGGKIVALGNNLQRLHTRSCGCIQAENLLRRNTTHGLCGTPLHSVWRGMKRRCRDENLNSYKDYGGRGIQVCSEWRKSLQAFASWAMSNGYKKGLQIDRINNDGDYEPSNCRFVTCYANSHNKRPLRSNNSTGYEGVRLRRKSGRFRAGISNKYINDGKPVNIGTFDTAWEACQARNSFIKDHGLPHRIQEKIDV